MLPGTLVEVVPEAGAGDGALGSHPVCVVRAPDAGAGADQAPRGPPTPAAGTGCGISMAGWDLVAAGTVTLGQPLLW